MKRRKAQSQRSGSSGGKSSAGQAPPAFVPPYRPSWFDHLARWVEGLPGPWWLFYLVAGTAFLVVFIVVQARAGAYADGFVVQHLFLALQPVFPLAAVHYLSRVAGRAVSEFQPAMGNADRLGDVRYRLTVTPARSTLIATLGGLLLMLMYLLQGPAGAAELRLAASTFSFWYVFAPLMGVAYGALFSFVAHQIRQLRRLFAQPVVIDLYQPDPLYAFSPLAARIAIVIAIISFGWGVDDPTTFTDLLSLITMIVMVTLALTVFFFPLWGAHRRLAAEKKRALAENGARLKSTTAELHRRLDSGKIVGMDELNKALASLDLERSHLTRVATWPWQPETLRGLVAALFLPIVIWLIQFGLQRMLG